MERARNFQSVINPSYFRHWLPDGMVHLLWFVYLPPLRALPSRSPAYIRWHEIDRLLYPTDVGPERSHSLWQTVIFFYVKVVMQWKYYYLFKGIKSHICGINNEILITGFVHRYAWKQRQQIHQQGAFGFKVGNETITRTFILQASRIYVDLFKEVKNNIKLWVNVEIILPGFKRLLCDLREKNATLLWFNLS